MCWEFYLVYHPVCAASENQYESGCKTQSVRSLCDSVTYFFPLATRIKGEALPHCPSYIKNIAYFLFYFLHVASAIAFGSCLGKNVH